MTAIPSQARRRAPARRASAAKAVKAESRSHQGESGQCAGGSVSGPPRGADAERAVVVTVTVAVKAVDPDGVTDAGEMLQAEAVAGSVQLNDTSWLRPPVGVMVIV